MILVASYHIGILSYSQLVKIYLTINLLKEFQMEAAIEFSVSGYVKQRIDISVPGLEGEDIVRMPREGICGNHEPRRRRNYLAF